MTMLRHCFIAGLASTAMMLWTASSKADTYTYATTSVGGAGNYVDINATVGTGAQTYTLSGNYYDQYVTSIASSANGADAQTFRSFCVDLFHDVSSSYSALYANNPLPLASEFSGTTGTTAPAGISNAALEAAAWIINTFGYGNLTDDQWAGVQIASWKAEFETNSSYRTDLSNGNVTFTGGSSQAALTDAAQYLDAWANAGYATSSAILVNYASDSNGNHYQYQLIPVPEPSTLVVAGLGGLGLVGYGLRRRRT